MGWDISMDMTSMYIDSYDILHEMTIYAMICSSYNIGIITSTNVLQKYLLLLVHIVTTA